MIPAGILAGGPAGGGGGYTGPLDIVPGAVVAYSQRAMAVAWVSNAITIRRDSDDATQSFATTTDNAVNKTAISAFIGGGSGFVPLWNDQSGNGNDAAQALADQQPGWTASEFNSRPGLTLLRNGNNMFSVNPSTLQGGCTVFLIGNAFDVTHTNNGPLFISSDANFTFGPSGSTLNNNALGGFIFNSDDSHLGGGYTDPNDAYFNTYALFDGAWNGTTVNLRFNGATQSLNTNFSDGTPIGDVTFTWCIGDNTAGDANGVIEVIVYDGILSDPDRLAIRQNIAAYYGITLS